MTKRTRRTHSAAFKAKVALEAVKGHKTITEIAQKHDVYPNDVSALALKRHLGVSWPTAWMMKHKIMQPSSIASVQRLTSQSDSEIRVAVMTQAGSLGQ